MPMVHGYGSINPVTHARLGRRGLVPVSRRIDEYQRYLEQNGTLEVMDVDEAETTESLYFTINRLSDGEKFSLRISDHSPTGRRGYRPRLSKQTKHYLEVRHDYRNKKVSFDKAIRHMETYGRDSQKKNPADNDARRLYQKFHGKPSTETVEVEYTTLVRENLTQLGILNELSIHLVTGEKAVLGFANEGEEAIILASSPDGKQLYLEGGDQSLDLKALKLSGPQWVRDLMVIGILKKLQYRTRKGFDGFELIDYYHRLGEETKVEPLLIYDNLNETMMIAGGQYEIKDVGIVN